MLRLFLLRKLEIELCINRVANLFIYWKWALNCISVNTIIKQKEGISLLFIPSLLFPASTSPKKHEVFSFCFSFFFFPPLRASLLRLIWPLLAFCSGLCLLLWYPSCTAYTVLSSPHPDIPYPLISAPSKALTAIQLIPHLQCILCHSQLSLPLYAFLCFF